MFQQTPIVLEPGLFSNRSRRGSKNRWCDGDYVRFTDGLPSQIGGWQKVLPTGDDIDGTARASIAWRPNDQNGRFSVFGTNKGAFKFDGSAVSEITPEDFEEGSAGATSGDGFGAGDYGEDLYGTPRLTTVTDNTIPADVWTFDMFGETLLGCWKGDGTIYEYTEGTDEVMVAVDNAPTAEAICVSDERHVFAFGADGKPGDVKWSDREDRTEWTPASDNRAGGYTLQVRSPFQCGKRVRGQVLAWTRTEVFAFAPLNNALVYSRDRISTEAGVAGKNAVAVVTDSSGEAAYWMGFNNFYVYDGYVRVLDCDLHDYVFNDINLFQASKFHAAVNTAFDEIWFFYCSAASGEIDRCVIYSFSKGTWSKATMERLTWIDANVYTNPLAIDASGNLYWHETGVMADGEAMGSYVLSHPITIGIGQQFAQVSQFWPDMQDGSAKCSVSFLTRNAPTEAAVTLGPYDFEIGDEFVPTAISCREFQLRIDGGNGWWELGIPSISMQGGSLR